MTAPVNDVIDSRVWRGTLTFSVDGAAADFSCQVTNVTITAAYDNDGNNAYTLCGLTLGAPRKSNGYHLTGTFIQDFDNPDGLWNFSFDHELEAVPFTFLPNDGGAAPTITGTVMVEMADFGGDMRTGNLTNFDWIMTQKPSKSYPNPPMAAPDAAQTVTADAAAAAAPNDAPDAGTP